MAAEEAVGNGAVTPPMRSLTFHDLPAEIQRDILSHCSQSDLICCALVSQHFRELASALLYRSFNILFPDDDDVRFESPIDGLAGGLDTFTTSDYNYAKHLRELSMDTVSTGVKAEHAYKPYLYSTSCGKFLNTLLYLTLQKARSLESFRWNIRVELSRPVYRELHKIQTLTKFHIRFQAGETYYMTPPPLPLSVDDLPATSAHWSDIPPPPLGPPPAMFTATLAGPMTTLSVIPSPPPLLPTSKQFSKSKASKRDSKSQEPPTLSGFKKLKSLSVLDIDNLDLTTELKTCIRNSSATLTELHLSLSDSLALQARRPPPDSDPDDSDVDDEFQVVPVSQSTTFDASGPAKAFRSQEERKLQEGILGRIFDVEPFILKKPALNQSPREAATSQEEGLEADSNEISEDPREEFVSSLRSVSARLMAQDGTRDISTAQQDILDIIEKAARKYVDSGERPSQQPNDSPESPTVVTKDEEQPSDGNDQASSVPVDTPNLAMRPKSKASNSDLSPDDIDIEHLDTVDDLEVESDGQQGKESEEKQIEHEEPEKPDTACSSAANSEDQETNSKTTSAIGLDKADTNLIAQQVNYESLLLELQQLQEQQDVFVQQVKAMSIQSTVMELDQIKDSETRLREMGQRTKRVQDAIETTRLEIKEAKNQVSGKSQVGGRDKSQRSIDEYLRDTRGIALETLGIHLIPVKASVLSRAIDLKCLKNLTLLNVGNQAPIWTLLSKENKTSPLALRSVFTDNVSAAFLNCISQLEELHDLFLLERSAKQKPESFAPRTTVTIDQIRRLVLKKHMHTLKRLMIKDESNSSGWDANQKAMILICNRGVQLEELALSMNIHAVHAFMQYFSGLINLRAINILRFRNNDTCIWVMREILNFIVDNLSHHPNLKLEWIAMEDDRLDRVIRPTDVPDEGEKRRAKGKEKATAIPHHSSINLPVLPTWGSDSESEDEDDDASNCGKRLRLKTVGVLQFYEVWGVKIFDKEVRSGRL
ncbi:unnamed protein product [Fusarium graminearum]|uniref:Chromosome 4, complete genome n=2 Tax=Gibberella zeae TaxID=5518 RepID=A0A0E0SAF3_GIBZE|nr:hypothetical protein FG05_09581 [Fusarium graminearum]CAF3537615.1 unnamed protein product [Fusarium graminearum]CAF3632758.1 unnamed protein product [Fusarium graminearum]CAF3659502.1 unnamed protein product [Fusarium graminearum]CAG1984527.1 unnamed protein product [Fusarium graminearum]